MTTLATCPHCGALIDDSAFCTICGKSPREEVEEVRPAPSRPVAELEVNRQRLVTLTTSVIGIIAVAALIWAWTHQSDPVYVATALPEPTPTEAAARTDATSPSVDAPDRRPRLGPLAAVPVNTRRGNGRAPWDDAPPINVITRGPLGDADYTSARAHVAALLDAVPAPWSLAEPHRPTIHDHEDEPIDLAAAEATQPFAARSFGHDEYGPIGDVWIAAAPEGDTVGAAYVTDSVVREQDVIETVSPQPGIRLVRVLVDGAPTWFADIVSPSSVRMFVPDDTNPAVLGAFIEDWQFAVLEPVT